MKTQLNFIVIITIIMFVVITFVLASCNKEELEIYDSDIYTLADSKITRSGESSGKSYSFDTTVTCYCGSYIYDVRVKGHAYITKEENGSVLRGGTVTFVGVENFVNEATVFWTSDNSYLITISFSTYDRTYVGNKEIIVNID